MRRRPTFPYTPEDIEWLMRPLPPAPPPLPSYSEGMKLKPYLDELDFYAAAAGLPTSSRLARLEVRFLDSEFSSWLERQIERAETWLERLDAWLARPIDEKTPQPENAPWPQKKSATIIPFPARPRHIPQRLSRS
jgi:hypothetical protein